MIPTNGENELLLLYKRQSGNNAYEYEKQPDLKFYGRPATAKEKNTYRIQKGVNGSSDSILIFSTNCPTEKIEDGDKVLYLGEVWTVQSVGYYLQDARLVSSRGMNSEYIMKRCPKGIRIG